MEMRRVLIINSTAIGEKGGTGITLENLWCDFPKECVLQLRMDSRIGSYNRNYKTIDMPTQFCRIPNVISQKRQNRREYQRKSVVPLIPSIRQTGIKAAIHDAIRGVIDVWPLNFKCINKEIDFFLPEIIYSCGASIRILKTSLYYSKRYNIPIILHLMDDWPNTMYTTSYLSRIFHREMLRRLKEVANRSEQSFAISESLSEKYEQVLGVKMLPLMNPASNIAENVNIHVDDTVRFVYAGSFGLNRWKSLLEIAEVLDEERNNGSQSQFDLYIPTRFLSAEMIKEFGKYNAFLHPYVDRNELQSIYKRTDVMVFAESFDENISEFTKYSLSTKIPEYMGTGNAILAYLPATSYANSYIREKEIAFVANSKSELYFIVQDILNNTKKRYLIANNALNIVRLEHSKESERKKLYDAIQKI